MKARWIIVALAVAGAGAFALSVQAGRWWTLPGFEIGPVGSYRCFADDCKPAGLGWVGGSERWIRTGIGLWAAGMLSMLILLLVAGSVAARRVPRLAAKTALVSIGTAIITGTLFIVQYPGVQGASVDRGLYLFVAAIALGAAACAAVLRAPPPPPAPPSLGA